MADETQTDTPPETEPSHEGTQGDRLDSLESKVDRIIERLSDMLPGKQEPDAADPEAEAPSVAAEVRAELAKLKQAEDRKAKAEARDSEMAELKETVKKIKERPPKEYRKVTQAVWGRDEDLCPGATPTAPKTQAATPS